MDNIIIIGSSSHAKVVIDLIEQEGKYHIVGLFEPTLEDYGQDLGYKVYHNAEDLPLLVQQLDLKGVIVAIGDNFVRSKVVQDIQLLCPKLAFVSSIHPRATIGKNVSIGEGTVILAGVTINTCSQVGRFCILNTHSSLDHDSVMEDYSSLAPGVCTGGKCRIGHHSAINIGATLVNTMNIGEHCIIGAGSTVLHNIESYKIAYGTPAKAISSRKPGDKYL